MASRVALRHFSAKPGLFQRPLTLCQQHLTLFQPMLIIHAMGFATKAQRRPADPNRPKTPLSAYMRFTADFRERMQGTDVKGKDLLVKCGQEWRNLPAEEKRPYEESYQDDMAAHRKLLDEYVSSGQQAAWKRDPELPKKPMTGYMQFMAEFRTQQPKEMKVTEASRAGGEQWKAMTEAEKRPYQQRYEEEKKSYDAAMAEYKASGKEEEWERRVGIYDQKMKAKKAEEELKEKEKAKKDKEKAKKEADAKKAKEKREKEKAKKDKEKAKKEADAKKAKEKREEEKAKKDKEKAKKEADAKKAKEKREEEKAKKEKAKKEADAKKAKEKGEEENAKKAAEESASAHQ